MRFLGGLCAGLCLVAGCSTGSGSAPSPSVSPSVSSPPSAAGVALRTSVELRPVLASSAGRCPAGLTSVADGALAAFEGSCLSLGPADLRITQAASVTAEHEPENAVPATGGWQVTVVLSPADAATFARVTAQRTGERIAIVAGERVYQAPTLLQSITDGTLVVVAFDEAGAKAFARLLVG